MDKSKIESLKIEDVNIAEPAPGMRTISAGDIIRQCNEAMSRMGASNPHRILLWNCAFAIKQLVERLDRMENPNGEQRPS